MGRYEVAVVSLDEGPYVLLDCTNVGANFLSFF